MTSEASPTITGRPYTERLLPGPGLFGMLLLLLPAVTLVMTPVNSAAAIPTAVVVYIVVAATLYLLSPTIRVESGRLTAGRATIPVAQLGAIDLLGADALRAVLGPGNDARNYLLVRGWIHRGIRVENIDPADPAPYWIITTRHPQKLAETIEAARG